MKTLQTKKLFVCVHAHVYVHACACAYVCLCVCVCVESKLILYMWNMFSFNLHFATHKIIYMTFLKILSLLYLLYIAIAAAPVLIPTPPLSLTGKITQFSFVWTEVCVFPLKTLKYVFVPSSFICAATEILLLTTSITQAEYMNRLDYKWKRQLAREQEESSTMHMINKMLLQNILPIHVGKNLSVKHFLYVLVFSLVVWPLFLSHVP